jgi:hypothetical protein
VYSGCRSYVAWVEPSDRLIVPSLPVTPALAVAGPATGGQYVVQDPLQFDWVGVSMANQYKVKPLAFVSTVTPAILVVFRAALAAAVLDGAAEVDGTGEVLELAGFGGDELPHPAAMSAAPASATAAHRLPIGRLGGRPVARLPERTSAMAFLQSAWHYQQRSCPAARRANEVVEPAAGVERRLVSRGSEAGDSAEHAQNQRFPSAFALEARRVKSPSAQFAKPHVVG